MTPRLRATMMSPYRRRNEPESQPEFHDIRHGYTDAGYALLHFLSLALELRLSASSPISAPEELLHRQPRSFRFKIDL
jgi:hypothetical protein